MSSFVGSGLPDDHRATGRQVERRTSALAPVDVDREAEISAAFASYADAGVPLWRHVAQHLLVTASVVRHIAELPAVAAELPHVDEAAAVASQLLEHGLTRRAMLGVSAVLEIPTTPGTFSDGSAKATLRRKVRAALKLGVTVRPVPPEQRRTLLALANLHERINEREQYRNVEPDNDDLLDYGLWLAAYDDCDTPLMLSVTPYAGEWAVLRYFRTLMPGQASSDARYLMAQELAETLAARGVRRLVDSSRPHWLPNGLRHFQRMIGFRLIRVPTVHISES